MEKLGVVRVDEDSNEKLKTASKDKLCPRCGRKVFEPRYCDVCGTLPWEAPAKK